MATSIIKSRARLLLLRAYHLRSLVSRVFSTGNENSNENKSSSENKDTAEIAKCAKPSESTDRWLNIRAGIFGPDDKRLCLPGDIGIDNAISRSNDIDLKSLEKFLLEKNIQLIAHNKNVKNLTKPNLDYIDTDLASLTDELDLEDLHLDLLTDSIEMESSFHLMKKQEILEFRAQAYPKIFYSDFLLLFPQLSVHPEDVTIISICQKTDNDMSGWSESVENEREKLIETFIDMGVKLSTYLLAEGYWSDFIDPTSGRPYRGHFSNSTMFETDDRYRYLGFKIEDLGCCKVITHNEWGSNIFVGTIFTNIHHDSQILAEALENFNMTPHSKS